ARYLPSCPARRSSDLSTTRPPTATPSRGEPARRWPPWSNSPPTSPRGAPEGRSRAAASGLVVPPVVLAHPGGVADHRGVVGRDRSEEHTSELQSREHL